MFHDKAINGKKTKVDEVNTTMSFTVSLKGVLKDNENLSVAIVTNIDTSTIQTNFNAKKVA